MKKQITLILLAWIVGLSTEMQAQEAILASPNGKIEVSVSQSKQETADWFLTVTSANGTEKSVVIPRITLGLEREDASFYSGLRLTKQTRSTRVKEKYTALHGKRKNCTNQANERTLVFVNADQQVMNVVMRAYDDGICFRYAFPEKKAGKVKITDERTSYEIPPTADRWLQRFVPSYEGAFPHQKEKIMQGEWGYPSLFQLENNACWMLISEANADRHYCATKLSNKLQTNDYKLTFPAASDGNGMGDVEPTISFPWKSPWRVVLIGQLSDIVESTLVDDVSNPSVIKKSDWIKPGKASWIYWAYNHGTKDYKRVCEYVDLAATMGWPYSLFDWEWDQMGNGGNLEDAVKYANEKGVKPMIWFNSGGPHNRVGSTPRDRLLTHEARVKTFEWLKKIGVYGIKVDFFESDKQNIMNYYIDILEDAADYQLMVNFHGSTVPRGWSRTYPHLMSMEAVFGAEQYNNGPIMTDKGAELNTIFPYTRNVIGPMDYTPVAFTNSQHPHTTTSAHELALPVIFESGIQHMADRPSGFYALPDEAKTYLRQVPAAWDDLQFLEGYSGEKTVLARRTGDTWYVAGINGLNEKGEVSLAFDFLKAGKSYKMLIIGDGETGSDFRMQSESVQKGAKKTISWLPRGGFVAVLTLIP